MAQSLRPSELREQLSASEGLPLLLDVREDWEYQICHIEGSRNYPVSQVPALLEELDPNARTVVICHHGVRSQHVAEFLERSGFSDVCNLEGGIDAWAREIDPRMPKY
ncbi:MAG: rhodanese-like domain-containing protein [Gammaproteobacteria bacterium]